MKKQLLFIAVCLFAASGLIAQDNIIEIEGGDTNSGLLETIINGDTTDTGERADPNRIYVLKTGNPHIQNAPIVIENAGGVLTIKGEEGEAYSVIYKQFIDEVVIGANNINCSLVMENIQYQTSAENGAKPWSAWNLKGDQHDLTVENCLFENVNGIIFNLNNVKGGCDITVRNTYFRDMHQGAAGQWWGSRMVQAKVPVDNFIFENNTVVGGGLIVLGQECLFDYSVINHNTFINSHKYPFLNQYWREVYFTNNLFVNANWVGEDIVNVATGGQDPDALLHGIVGIDTLELSIQIQGRLINDDTTALDASIDEISDYIFYAADNVVVSSAELDNYYSGGLNDNSDWNAPESYLTWSGIDGPHQIFSVPGLWSNSRTDALVADHDNLKMENNSVYAMRAGDLGMATTPLTQDQADILVQWNQVKWGVPDVESPTKAEFSIVYFGDSLTTTVAGIETENGGGITKISDVIEDFSYTNAQQSKSDGLRIGALHWNDEDFDRETSITRIKAAYAGTFETYNPIGVEQYVSKSELGLRNYPNPFSASTTIEFDLPVGSHVNLSVYDMSGRLVTTLLDENRSGGVQKVDFSSSNVSSGSYFFILKTDNKSITNRMMILK